MQSKFEVIITTFNEDPYFGAVVEKKLCADCYLAEPTFLDVAKEKKHGLGIFINREYVFLKKSQSSFITYSHNK